MFTRRIREFWIGSGVNSKSDAPLVGNCQASSQSFNYLRRPWFGQWPGLLVGEECIRVSRRRIGTDNRLSFYFGDNWKIRRNFNLTLGLHYSRDTGDDTDLGNAALSVFDTSFIRAAKPVNQRTRTLARSWLAWDTGSNGKMVIRGGIGLFYENSIWNNVLFDPAGDSEGFSGDGTACNNGKPNLCLSPPARSGQYLRPTNRKRQLADNRAEQEYQQATVRQRGS